ncbi:MAG: hypothetical protein ABSG80_05235 [Verrucomicrobiota bacterium]|jgi:hypothetical protein
MFINGLYLLGKINVAYANRLLYIKYMNEKLNRAAQMLGRLGGKAGTGKAKARKVTSKQARAAVMVRWNKVRKAARNKKT